MWPFSNSNSNNNNDDDKKNKWKEDRDENFTIDQDYSNPNNNSSNNNSNNGVNSNNNKDDINKYQQYEMTIAKDTTLKHNDNLNTFETNDYNKWNNNDNNDKENIMKDENIIKDDDKEQQFKQLQNKILNNHTLQWIFAMGNGIYGGIFLGTVEFVFQGIIVGGLTRQLSQPGYIKQSFRESMKSGFRGGSVICLYSGVSNSSRIIRQKNDLLNHFVGGFVAGSITSAVLGFGEGSSGSSSTSVTTIHVKSDPSGVFKQVKSHHSRSSMRHMIYGIGLGTFFTAWHVFTSSKNKNSN